MKSNTSLIIFIGFLLLLSAVNAQKTRATLFFKDGIVKKGYGKLSGSDAVKFKANKSSKTVKYNFSSLKRVKIIENKEASTYEYVKIIGKAKPKVLKQIIMGRVHLYTLITQGHTPMYTNGNNGASPAFIGGNFYNIKNLYVRHEHEEAATHLGSNQLFTKNFKEAASNFFKDCAALVSKIQKKEFKKRDVKKIVAFYNTKCD